MGCTVPIKGTLRETCKLYNVPGMPGQLAVIHLGTVSLDRSTVRTGHLIHLSTYTLWDADQP